MSQTFILSISTDKIEKAHIKDKTRTNVIHKKVSPGIIENVRIS